jgi:hypothetical protein
MPTADKLIHRPLFIGRKLLRSLRVITGLFGGNGLSFLLFCRVIFVLFLRCLFLHCFRRSIAHAGNIARLHL